MQSARIAFPCFPRPRFELGLSSRVPHVSAKRARPSSSIRQRLLDHPSQRSQSWPVNTISIVTICRITDHHASAVKASPGSSSRRMRSNVLETSIAKRIGVAAISLEDHSLNSQTGFVLGQPRDFKCVLFQALPRCAKLMILLLLARVVACVPPVPHRSRSQLAIALVTPNLCKRIVKCGASVFPGHCRKAKFTSQSMSKLSLTQEHNTSGAKGTNGRVRPAVIALSIQRANDQGRGRSFRTLCSSCSLVWARSPLMNPFLCSFAEDVSNINVTDRWEGLQCTSQTTCTRPAAMVLGSGLSQNNKGFGS